MRHDNLTDDLSPLSPCQTTTVKLDAFILNTELVSFSLNLIYAGVHDLLRGGEEREAGRSMSIFDNSKQLQG